MTSTKKAGAALSRKKIDAIDKAARQGDAAALRIALEGVEGPIPWRPLSTPLAQAVASGDPSGECVRLLLPLCSPDAQDEKRRTALMAAIEKGLDECVSLLLPVSDLTIQDANGMNALMIALTTSDGDISGLLAGSDPAQTDRHGFTALHHAANQCSCPRSMELLLTRCDPNAMSRHNETPLMIAAQNVSAQCLAILAPKSDVQLQDNEGRTALRMVVESKRFGGRLRAEAADQIAPWSTIHEARRALRELGEAGMPQTAALLEAVELRRDAGMPDDPRNGWRLIDLANGRPTGPQAGDAGGDSPQNESVSGLSARRI